MPAFVSKWARSERHRFQSFVHHARHQVWPRCVFSLYARDSVAQFFVRTCHVALSVPFVFEPTHVSNPHRSHSSTVVVAHRVCPGHRVICEVC